MNYDDGRWYGFSDTVKFGFDRVSDTILDVAFEPQRLYRGQFICVRAIGDTHEFAFNPLASVVYADILRRHGAAAIDRPDLSLQEPNMLGRRAWSVLITTGAHGMKHQMETPEFIEPVTLGPKP